MILFGKRLLKTIEKPLGGNFLAVFVHDYTNLQPDDEVSAMSRIRSDQHFFGGWFRNVQSDPDWHFNCGQH